MKFFGRSRRASSVVVLSLALGAAACSSSDEAGDLPELVDDETTTTLVVSEVPGGDGQTSTDGLPRDTEADSANESQSSEADPSSGSDSSTGTDAGQETGGAESDDDGSSPTPEPTEPTDAGGPPEDPEPFEEAAVYEDPDGVYADTPIDEVMALCGTDGTPAACGQLGERLADFDTMSEADVALARCTASTMVQGSPAEQFAAALTLTVLYGTDESVDVGLLESLNTIRMGDTANPQFEAAVSNIASFASQDCPAG